MIGVVAAAGEEEAVREFFELFKTPWEFFRPDRRYDVLLCAGGVVPAAAARLALVYAGRKVPLDVAKGIEPDAVTETAGPTHAGLPIPIYGSRVTFRGESVVSRTSESGGNGPSPAAGARAARLVRVGYDLFHEVRELLTSGQPSVNAGIPTLERHIGLLRDLITAHAGPLLEIPPVPEGHRFIACLTHDVDHPSIRRHKLDHTTFGFLYRALVGSVVDVWRRRAPGRSLVRNWGAAARLPLVHLGLARDFWRDFDRYLELDAGRESTFFVIPFAGNPGRTARGEAPKARASRYGAREIGDQVRRLALAGCEIGVHGIDAWRDGSRGGAEREEVSRVAGVGTKGVRMHWLYGDEHSPAALERAGFAYDSTVGYNDTVGYRAGTAQVFKPLGATTLLELPLHVMDTALFYPRYLHLRPEEARARVGGIIDHAWRDGGVVTLNWHDRSISPERLWDGCYVNLIDDLRAKGAWFTGGARAVAWFRKRRSAVFETVGGETGRVRVSASSECAPDTPGLRVRVHRRPGQYTDAPLSDGVGAGVAV